jgi:hypothetical protein
MTNIACRALSPTDAAGQRDHSALAAIQTANNTSNT